jgi:hypothetical protein
MKDAYLQGLPVKLQRISKFLGNRPYFAGENVNFRFNKELHGTCGISYKISSFIYADHIRGFHNVRDSGSAQSARPGVLEGLRKPGTVLGENPES